MKKRFLAAAYLAAATVLLAGCQSGQGAETSAAGGGEAPAETAAASSEASDEDKTLTLWIFLNPE